MLVGAALAVAQRSGDVVAGHHALALPLDAGREGAVVEFLDEVEHARSVLILGDGDGRFTAELLGRNRSGQIDSVELSPRMLELAKLRVGEETSSMGRLHFWNADARTMALPRQYDLIISHFFLDCFIAEDLDLLVGRV